MKTISGIKTSTAMWLLFAAGAAVMAATGCDSKTESGFSTSKESEDSYIAPPEPLKLVAIGVPEFGDEISRQWAAQRDGELNIVHVSLEDFDGGSEFPEDVDLVVHPSSINVDLISRKLIRVFPAAALDDEEMNRSAFLHHCRKSLVRHDDKTWSVSLGDQQFRLLYRRDILESLDIEVPTTWEELERELKKLADIDSVKKLEPIVIPTKDSMASQVFMARVASSIRDQGKLTSFFDRKTMTPTIAAAPFVDSLQKLKSYYELCGRQLSTAETFSAFANGEAVFAIGWPAVSGDSVVDSLESESATWGISRLPGSDQFFDLKQSRWQKRGRGDDTKVDLLGIQATNVSIADRTSNAKDAAEFVIWLTDKRNSQKLLQGVAAPFRATHVARVGQWYSIEQADRQFLDQLADLVQETHQSRIFLMFPQLPGKRQYLKILDDAIVQYFADDNGDAAKTLEKVAQDWESLTEKLGRKSQIGELRSGNGI